MAVSPLAAPGPNSTAGPSVTEFPFTLPRGLADLVSGSLGGGTQYPLKLGAALLATIPVAVIFVIFQRRFVRGANEGSDKG